MTPMEELLVQAAKAKAVLDEVQKEFDTAQEALIASMKAANATRIGTQFGADDYAATLIEATRVVIDEGQLAKKLGAAKWNKVTKTVLDKAKLEAHIATGAIDPNVVAMCAEEKKNKPYVNFRIDKGVRDPEEVKQPVIRKKKRSPEAAKALGK